MKLVRLVEAVNFLLGSSSSEVVFGLSDLKTKLMFETYLNPSLVNFGKIWT